MKRPILLAALLAASSAVVPAASAEETHTGQMLRMFDISTPSAGVVNFRGTGTANFNQSIGTNNNFNVGSSTNLGVNASASSTEDYTATGDAHLALAGTSRLQQTIGTATSAFNVATASEASSTAAHTSAFEVANSAYGSEFTSDYSDSLKTEGGWELRTAGVDENATSGTGWYSDLADTDNGETGFVAVASGQDGDTVWSNYSEENWSSSWQDKYEQTYNTSYESAVKNSSTEAVNTDQSGIISGVFSTVDYGASTSGVTSSQTEEMSVAANAAASEQIIKNDDGSFAINENGNYAGQSLSQEEMEAAYDKEFTKNFNTSFSAAAGLMRSSDSTVTVTGIGVIADVNASDQSTFKASTTLLDNATRDGNGNGQASSGANLATSSYANQSNSSTASAFMQAFSGGLPDQAGATTIQKVNPIYETAGDPTTAIVGYDIETSVVRDPLVETTSYDIDTDATDGTVTSGG